MTLAFLEAQMLRTLVCICLVLSLTTFAAAAENSPVDWVNTMVGTDTGPEFSNGNNYPTVAMPFGMTFWTPQTNERNWLYTYKADRIQGLRATHSPSVWMGDYGSFSVMPMLGPLEVKTRDRASNFKHESEIATPYYYKVRLEDYGIDAEMAPSMRAAHMRFTYDWPGKPYVVFDAHPGGGTVEVDVEARTVSGFNEDCGFRKVPGFRFYFVLEFDRNFVEHGTWHDRGAFLDSTRETGHHVGAFVSFALDKGEAVNVRIGTSFVSKEQARRNLDRELPGWDIELVKAKAREAWSQELGRVQAWAHNPDHLSVFYTAMYRSHLFPRIFYELDENLKPVYFSPFDGKIHDGVMFTDTGFWDTYRAQFPLLAILKPGLYQEFIQGLVNAYNQGGWLPKWPSPGYRSVMTGTHGDCVIADAYAKRLRRFDSGGAMDGMINGATRKSDTAYFGRVGIQYYLKSGYVPADLVEESLSRTLEFAYDDFCIGAMARIMGKNGTADRFDEAALSYRKVYDPKTGFMRGRNLDGTWVTPFDPVEWGGPYVEGNAWHFLWSVQHDIPGLIKLLGGKEAFVAKLERLFEHPPEYKVGSYGRVIHEMREMEAGGMGQYAHANEPVHHVPYLYNYAGRPWKTQEKVRHIMENLYTPKPDGLLGDEDNGQMSAWFIFSAMGFYPLCPGRPYYALGSPLVDKAVVHLADGKQLIVQARDNSPANRYVQAVTFDGEPYGRTWIEHDQLMKGGTLEFVMGPEPNTEWGSGTEAAPPSCLTGR